MVMESEPRLTFAERVNVVRENGVSIINSEEQYPPFRQRTVNFMGDEDEGSGLQVSWLSVVFLFVN